MSDEEFDTLDAKFKAKLRMSEEMAQEFLRRQAEMVERLARKNNPGAIVSTKTYPVNLEEP